MKKIPGAVVWFALGALSLGPAPRRAHSKPCRSWASRPRMQPPRRPWRRTSSLCPRRRRRANGTVRSPPNRTRAGSAENNRLAGVLARAWRAQGWEDVTLRRYDVLHSRPRAVSLEMTSPAYFKASLREAPYSLDPDTRNPRVDGSYFGYSASGDVTAELVYAHSGNPEDYELLRKNGISVKGKVVIVRYSNPYSYRGFKALTAEREGAAALLIYSDPADDGYARGKVFPDGPWGPESHIQRGAITYDYIVPGDPTTPGWASVPGAKHIDPADSQSLPKIMALPLSWQDAKPLLEHMNGAPVPAQWRGALPITYRFEGSVAVHVHIDMDTSIKPYTVVEARIRGSELPDEWVLIGNHRDAWVYGGVDPVSGTAAMLELTRSLGELSGADCVRAARSSSAAGTGRNTRSPDPPSGASSSRRTCRKSWSRISTWMRRWRGPPPARVPWGWPSSPKPWHRSHRCSSRRRNQWPPRPASRCTRRGGPLGRATGSSPRPRPMRISWRRGSAAVPITRCSSIIWDGR